MHQNLLMAFIKTNRSFIRIIFDCHSVGFLKTADRGHSEFRPVSFVSPMFSVSGELEGIVPPRKPLRVNEFRPCLYPPATDEHASRVVKRRAQTGFPIRFDRKWICLVIEQLAYKLERYHAGTAHYLIL